MNKHCLHTYTPHFHRVYMDSRKSAFHLKKNVVASTDKLASGGRTVPLDVIIPNQRRAFADSYIFSIPGALPPLDTDIPRM